MTALSNLMPPGRKKTAPKERAHGKDPSRVRLDVAVAKSAGLSRERAQALILAGSVLVNGCKEQRPSHLVTQTDTLKVGRRERYVSRGGHKLEKALLEFGWSPAGRRCLDVGASTGGFTDCLLQAGAAAVVALDVGYGHLAWKLRQDSRVTTVERCNFRHADVGVLGAPFQAIVADVSFISLQKLVDKFAQALSRGGWMVALVKPQFEAGRNAVQRGGVVRDPKAQADAITRVIDAFTNSGIVVQHLTYSPLKGPAGNIEFLIGGVRDGTRSAQLDVAGVVRQAHEALD